MSRLSTNSFVSFCLLLVHLLYFSFSQVFGTAQKSLVTTYIVIFCLQGASFLAAFSLIFNPVLGPELFQKNVFFLLSQLTLSYESFKHNKGTQLKQQTGVVSKYKRKLGKEPFLNSMFMHFVIQSVPFSLVESVKNNKQNLVYVRMVCSVSLKHFKLVL